MQYEDHIQRMRDFYSMKPGAPIYRREFGFYVLDRWKSEGHITDSTDLAALFGYDPPAAATVYGLGWCEAGLCPVYEEKIIEDRGEYELWQDFAGRHVLCFKGRRNGFMPEYLDHPVKDIDSFEREIAWRMDPATPGRVTDDAAQLKAAKEMSARGGHVIQGVVGGYMYLRSLIGPEGTLYMFYDDPELIHRCMRAWFELADAVIERHQREVDFDELFFGEDICYKGGPLISPDMMREFLLPYYSQLYENMKLRARDKSRHITFQIDTDGFCEPVIDLYREIGVDMFSPFEVAAGNDLLRAANKYPELLMTGGIDKRAIAAGGDVIKRHLDSIMPAMRARGGFIPTCDHGVPEETSFENYMLYRRLMLEYCG